MINSNEMIDRITGSKMSEDVSINSDAILIGNFDMFHNVTTMIIYIQSIKLLIMTSPIISA